MSSIQQTQYTGNGADAFYKTLADLLPKAQHKVIAPDVVFTLPSGTMQGHWGMVPLRAGY